MEINGNLITRGQMAAAALDTSVFKAYTAKDAVPDNWHEKAGQAWQYYCEEPLISNIINCWRVFALGDEIKVTCEDSEVEQDARKFYNRQNLNRFVKDMVLQLLVKGDAIGYFERTTAKDDIGRVICVNPTTVNLQYKSGKLIEAVQKAKNAQGASATDEISLPLEKIIHYKWNCPQYSQRGNSMVLPAFESIELLRDYRRAERAIARRWTTPLRLIKVGGVFGKKYIMPDKREIEDLRNVLNSMDLQAGAVVPNYVTVETHGTDGHTLDTNEKVKQIKEDILVAMGMSRSLITGDGPNYATASISLQKFIVQLKEIKQAARDILDFVFYAWQQMKGNEDKKIAYQFNDLDLHNETDIKKIFLEMYDRGLISQKTLQGKMGLDPALENANKEQEKTVTDNNFSVDDLVKLISLDVMTPNEARHMLGLKDNGEREPEAAATEQIYGSC